MKVFEPDNFRKLLYGILTIIALTVSIYLIKAPIFCTSSETAAQMERFALFAEPVDDYITRLNEEMTAQDIASEYLLREYEDTDTPKVHSRYYKICDHINITVTEECTDPYATKVYTTANVLDLDDMTKDCIHNFFTAVIRSLEPNEKTRADIAALCQEALYSENFSQATVQGSTEDFFLLKSHNVLLMSVQKRQTLAEFEQLPFFEQTVYDYKTHINLESLLYNTDQTKLLSQFERESIDGNPARVYWFDQNSYLAFVYDAQSEFKQYMLLKTPYDPKGITTLTKSYCLAIFSVLEGASDDAKSAILPPLKTAYNQRNPNAVLCTDSTYCYTSSVTTDSFELKVSPLE